MGDQEQSQSGSSQQDRLLTRRGILKYAAVGAGTIIVLELLGAWDGTRSSEPSQGQAPVTLTFVSYGGGYQAGQMKAWLGPFMKAHPNITIVQDEPTDYSKLKAMVQSGNVTWDVVDVGNDFGLSSAAPYLTPLDCSIVPCDVAAPRLMNSRWRVAEQTGAYVIAYRTDMFKTPPRNWADFYNVKRFPGKRGQQQYVSGGVLESALLADGVAPSHLYPLDVNRALKKLSTIRDHLVWWTSGVQSEQLIASGEVSMCAMWNGRARHIALQGKPVAIQWNQGLQFGEYFVVPKGSKHVREAMQLIAYMVSPQHNGAFSTYWPVGPGTRGAVVTNKAMRPWLPTSHESQLVGFNDQYWDKNLVQMTNRFQQWLTG
jgi:putative spermidine/putrescine transport system substrate-binding protein